VLEPIFAGTEANDRFDVSEISHGHI
jgi:hypothetical protein